MFKWLSNYRAACSIYMGTLSLTLFINHPTSAKQAEPSESVHEKLSVELLLAGLFFFIRQRFKLGMGNVVN